jgi:hypothetical protein
MVWRATIPALACATISAALIIGSPRHVSNTTPREIGGPMVNRANKGDRLSSRPPLPRARPMARTKLPIGCDPSISPLTGVRSENNSATHCTS